MMKWSCLSKLSWSLWKIDGYARMSLKLMDIALKFSWHLEKSFIKRRVCLPQKCMDMDMDISPSDWLQGTQRDGRRWHQDDPGWPRHGPALPSGWPRMVPKWPRMIQDSPRLTQQDGTGKLGMSAGSGTLTQSEHNKLPQDKKKLMYNPSNLMPDLESASKNTSTFDPWNILGTDFGPRNLFFSIRLTSRYAAGWAKMAPGWPRMAPACSSMASRMTQDGSWMAQDDSG